MHPDAAPVVKTSAEILRAQSYWADAERFLTSGGERPSTRKAFQVFSESVVGTLPAEGSVAGEAGDAARIAHSAKTNQLMPIWEAEMDAFVARIAPEVGMEPDLVLIKLTGGTA